MDTLAVEHMSEPDTDERGVGFRLQYPDGTEFVFAKWEQIVTHVREETPPGCEVIVDDQLVGTLDPMLGGVTFKRRKS